LLLVADESDKSPQGGESSPTRSGVADDFYKIKIRDKRHRSRWAKLRADVDKNKGTFGQFSNLFRRIIWID
jgi:hypothetical protein